MYAQRIFPEVLSRNCHFADHTEQYSEYCHSIYGKTGAALTQPCSGDIASTLI